MKRNLKNLYNIVKLFDYQVIVTVREPVSAMFSFFVHKYKTFKKLDQSFVEIALKDKRFEIYNYKKFFQEMHLNFDKKKIFVKKFEEIINNELNDLIRLFKIKGFHQELFNYNKRKKSKNSIQTESNFILINSNVLIFLNKIGLKRLVEYLNMEPFMRRLYILLNKIKYNMKEEVVLPSEDEFNKLRMDLFEETNYLNIEYKIDYTLKF